MKSTLTLVRVLVQKLLFDPFYVVIERIVAVVEILLLAMRHYIPGTQQDDDDH